MQIVNNAEGYCISVGRCSVVLQMLSDVAGAWVLLQGTHSDIVFLAELCHLLFLIIITTMAATAAAAATAVPQKQWYWEGD